MCAEFSEQYSPNFAALCINRTSFPEAKHIGQANSVSIQSPHNILQASSSTDISLCKAKSLGTSLASPTGETAITLPASWTGEKSVLLKSLLLHNSVFSSFDLGAKAAAVPHSES